MRDDVLLVYDEAMLGHNPEGWDPGHPEWTAAVQELLAAQYPDKDLDVFSHPERPGRVGGIVEALVESLGAQPNPAARWLAPAPVTREQLERVHSAAHVAFIDGLAGRSCWLAQDTTAVSPGSVAAAKLAAGAGVTAIDALLADQARRAFCVVRPPGHHALTDKAMGFCLYNNAAVAAAHALARGLRRVLVWDWDLHHGNGTQDIFYDRGDVLFLDSHCAAPFYPGTGALEETGAGAGLGKTLNIPLPPGSGNAALVAVAEQVLAPAVARFRPELVLVSAGFDGHYLDQTFAMDETGYAALTAQVAAIADRYAGGPMVMLLEGGYNAEALAASASACVQALAGNAPAAINTLTDDPGLAAVEAAAAFHRGLFLQT